MGPLYKRYIPPKAAGAAHTAVATAAGTSAKTLATRPVPAATDETKKRKRVRSEEEVAERKAKKLKKKGTEATTANNASASSSTNATNATSAQVEGVPYLNGSVDGTEPQGPFAHIKNAKKRHKLEKEARKSRRDAAHTNQDTAPDEVTSTSVKGGSVKKNKDAGLLYGDDNVGGRSDQIAAVAEGDRDKNPDQESDGNQSQKVRKRKSREAVTDDHEAKTALSGQQNGDSLSKPKKRRHKLESVLQDVDERAQADTVDDDEHLKKHTGIIGKFQKSSKRAQGSKQSELVRNEKMDLEPTLLDLVPFPQPEPAAIPEFVPDSSALPAWLAKPTIVSSDIHGSFADLNLDSKIVQSLSKLGFNNVLPVQQALIPMLLPPGSPGSKYPPGTESVLPDITVSAPTGSGKTIAYLLPITEALKKNSSLGKKRALVIVPTRELVVQVATVAESLAKGSSIKIGMATGVAAFKDEQAKLVKHGRRYDPPKYNELILKAHRRNYPPPEDSEEFEQYLDELEDDNAKEEQHMQDVVSTLADHVPTYDCAVDILVATPGRLVEHITSTLGFTLAHLQWLVLDEADKLLDLQYGGFLETINNELSRPRSVEEQDAREKYLRSTGGWDDLRERRVRKVMLSATMTRDISKLLALKLKRPEMIVIRGSEQDTESATNGARAAETGGVKEVGDDFELPPTLSEYCVHVGDGSEKPLFMVELLQSRLLNAIGSSSKAVDRSGEHRGEQADNSDTDGDSSSDSSSTTESELSSSVSSTDDSSDSEASHDDTKTSKLPEDDYAVQSAVHPERTAMLQRWSERQTDSSTVPTILIFTSSTEAADRLSHLLKALKPEWASWTTSMTRAAPKRKSLPNAKSTEPMIIVSTDRAGRGLDAIGTRTITHVVQYDVPHSATGYVHRVGRTARAGKPGEAWTLYTHSQARWFMKEVARAKNIKRAEEVEKVKLGVDYQGLKEQLSEVVESMRDEVMGYGGKPQ